MSQVRYCKEKVMDCYFKILDQVGERFERGVYNLDRYRLHRGRFTKTGRPLITDTSKDPVPDNVFRRRGKKNNSNAIKNTMEHIKKIRSEE